MQDRVRLNWAYDGSVQGVGLKYTDLSLLQISYFLIDHPDQSFNTVHIVVWSNLVRS